MIDFDLDDLLNEPTVQRSENTDETAPDESFDLNTLEFEPEPTPNELPTEEPEEVEEPYTDKMAQE
ncbi:MAG TPA: hypothetical protein PLP27_12540, partial [Crocinitomicaceae bacterium]|nr:hypothetical protein [Crocinitomicaceae bacterium]